MCVSVFQSLTAVGFALLIAVDEEVSGALRTEGQQDTLQHCWQQNKTQQKGPQGGIPHERFNSKDLCKTEHIIYNTVQLIEHNT